MKKYILPILAFATAVLSCRTPHTTVVKPFDGHYPDSTRSIRVPDRLPYMQQAADSATYLYVPKGNISGTIPEMDIRYIPLETTEECLIKSISKLESDDRFIFILDYFGNQVLRFSQEDGAFLTKYGKLGQKAGEYKRVTGMAVDKQRKEVCIEDNEGLKLLYFDYEGTFLREEPIYYFYTDFEFSGDRMVLETGMNKNKWVPSINNHRLVLADREQVPQAINFPLSDDYTCNQSIPRVLQTCGKDVYYTNMLSDTVWQVKEDGRCEAKYIFKFPGRDNLFSEHEFLALTNEEYKKRIQNEPRRGPCYITHDFIFAEIWNGSYFLYCIETGHYLYNPSLPQKFDMPNLNFATHTLNGTSFVKELPPTPIYRKHRNKTRLYDRETFKDYWEEEMNPNERRMLESVREGGNPVLMVMDIKPF